MNHYIVEPASGPVGGFYKRLTYKTWIDAQRALLRYYWSSPWSEMRVVCTGIGKEG